MGSIVTQEITGTLATIAAEIADIAPLSVEAVTAATATLATVASFTRVTSGNMATGFGPRIAFGIEDDTSGPITAGLLAVQRGSADNDSDMRFYINSSGTLTERMRIENAQVYAFTQLVAFFGSLVSGVAATNRGIVRAYNGTSTNTPGCFVTYDTDGVPWYWFADTSGRARIASALPTSNTDGIVIGLQF